MKIIDVTHTISPRMPVYPGTEPPVFVDGCTIDDDGFVEKKMTMYSHTGTHMDAPAHIIKGANTLDELSADHFFGKALVLNLAGTDREYIKIDELKPYQDLIKGSDFVLLKTGWSQFWGSEKYFNNYPILSSEAASWLSGFDLKGIGSDTISPDEIETPDFPIHKMFLSRDIVIIENLTNLDALPLSQFTFSCFPLKIQRADGSPVRAVAIVN
jgi:arylformamidase